jgi:hypothetical protein
MSSLWGNITKATSIGVQYVKEKTGVVKAEVNPHFESACERFQVIKQQFTTFKSDVDVIVKTAKSASQAGTEIARTIVEAEQTEGTQIPPIIKPINVFFNKNKSMADEHFAGLIDSNIFTSFNKYLEQLDALDKLKDSRVKLALFVASLKNDIKTYSKEGKSEKLTKAKIEYEEQNKTLEQQTAQFINEVNDLWNSRVAILEAAMFEFVGISYTYSQFVYGNLQIMQDEIQRGGY